MKKFSFLFVMLATCITLQAESYGILVNGTTYFAGTLNTGNTSFTEYMVLGVPLESGDYFQLYDKEKAAAWAVALDDASTTGVTFSSDRYNCTADGCYDCYIKLEYAADQLYVGVTGDCSGNTGETISVGKFFGSAESGVKTIYYMFDDANRTATVTYCGSSYDEYNEYTGNVVIPATVTYGSNTYSVTSIGESAFRNCRYLTSVTIPNSVTSIGKYAFRGCSGLTSVTIPNSVTSIGGYVFYGCSGLTSVTIGNSVTSIGSYAFYGCSGLTSVTIGNSVTSIGNYAFDGCSGLTSVNIPNSVTSIGSSAFWGCSSLTSVNIPNSVTSIGDYAFWGCSGLTSVTIPNSVTSIEGSAFSGCSGLTSVTIPNSVTSIGDWAFEDCSGLTSVTIGNSVTSIGRSAFEGCSGLTSVTIPNSVTSIGSSAFNGCSGLTSVTIPNSVTSIGSSAFNGCSGLTSVTIGNSVMIIGDQTFYGCSSLTSVVWNAKKCADFQSYYNHGDSYSDAPFYYIASQITSFTFGSEVEHIPAYLCYGMKNLTSVIIPNSVTSIGKYAFCACSGLTSVTIGNSVTSIGEGAFNGCSGLTSVTIPNSVTSIGEDAFLGCSGLTSVTIGNSVTSIGDWAFRGCSGLTSVVWNAKNCADSKYYDFSSATHNKGPFYYIASQITSFTFDSEVEHIPAYLCYGMENLTSVTIPNSVTSIGDQAFYNCSGLTSVTIGNSVMFIGDYQNQTFYGCSSLTSVVWNAKNCADVSYNYYAPFYDIASQITSFTFGSEVEHIPAYLYYGMENLTSVTIPNSVTSIGESAFDGCTALRDITALPTVPPTCGSYAFYNVPTGATLRCPCESREAYQAADTWSQFTNIIPADFPNVTLLADEEQGSVQVEDRICESKSIVISATANAGYHFVQWSNGATDATYTFILTQDTILAAEFALNQHKVTVTAGENGSVKVVLNDEETAETTFAYGTEITLTATADEGYCFVQWDDDNIDNPRTITVTEDITLSAEFAPSQTALETVTLSPVYAVDGRIVCESEFRIYDLLGRDVTRLNGSLQGVYVVKTANAAQKVIVK